MKYDIPAALQALKPGAEWVLRGTEWSGLEWLDKNGDPEIDGLRDWLLISHLQIGGEPWAEVLVSEYNNFASVEIAKARGFKCERCWHYEIEMSKDQQHPNICKRCEKVVLAI